MDPWQPRPTTPKKENLIQGPRPTPLRVSNNSVKIRKPPRAPQSQPPPPPPAPAPAPGNQPVIIYSVSPKPYYVEASDFRSLVQHLTGRDTSAPVPAPEASTSGGTFEPPVSPAARLAALERTSPKEWDRRRGGSGGGEGGVSMTVPGEDEIDVISQMQGILSPAPENLPVISAGMFSPAAAMGGEGNWFFEMSEMLSPYMSNMSFMPSPSSALLFSNPSSFVSPSPSGGGCGCGGECYNIFDFS